MRKAKPKKVYHVPRVRSRKLQFLTNTFGSWPHHHDHHGHHHGEDGHRF